MTAWSRAPRKSDYKGGIQRDDTAGYAEEEKAEKKREMESTLPAVRKTAFRDSDVSHTELKLSRGHDGTLPTTAVGSWREAQPRTHFLHSSSYNDIIHV